MGLLECRKAFLSEHLWIVNAFTCPKHSWNLHCSTFILVSHLQQKNWARKHLGQWDLKSQDGLVTRWLLIKCILVIIERISRNLFKGHYLKNRNHFLKIFLYFCNLEKFFPHFEKEDHLQIFGRLLNPRKMVTRMPESSCFRTQFERQRVHGSQILLKSAQQHFYLSFPLTTDKVSYKTFLSVRSEISRLGGKTLTTYHMYCGHNWQNFSQHVQTPLCQEPETFSQNFIPFLKSFYSAFWKKRSSS